jgi:DNA-binding transcriptional regulator YiaG
MTISAALKRWRSEQSFSQAMAAAKLGVSLRTYQEWEQSRRKPAGKALSSLWPLLGPILNPQAALNGSFAELMKAYRKQTRQNRCAAAKSLNVSPGAIQDWEQERRVPSGATIVRLLPLFEAAAKEWNRARSAPPSAEETGLIAMLRSYAKRRPGRRKRVFADPREGRKATLGWLKRARADLEKARWDFERDRLQESIGRLKCDLRRYERRIAEARRKSRARETAAGRLASPAARVPSFLHRRSNRRHTGRV